MRKIKFRGIIDNQMWYACPLDGWWDQFWALVEDDTIGQYVGLLDKNGEEIFEGDIVQYKGGVVIGKNHKGKAYIQSHGGVYKRIVEWNSIKNGWNIQKGDHFQIIGNIHENKKLIIISVHGGVFP